MDISEEKMVVYRETARREHAERRAKIEARNAHAWVLARQAADILKREFGATRVVAIGSLLRRQRFHLMSDIDLVAWNVQHYFRAVARLIDLEPGFDFDLIPAEDAKPWVMEIIAAEGVEL